MCGIAGFCGQWDKAPAQADVVKRMVAAITHRGPDAQGIHVEDKVGFGHARLSIIDLASGAQPMLNADGSVWITFNGEIFNYVELRRDLIARGHRFRTDSDTEVILQLYEAMGPDCVTQLNGDFAFAIWDSKQQQLMLARDRMGVRPLYYTQNANALFFASEVKALLQAPGVGAALDPIALDQIMTLWLPLSPRTIFKDILELPPAHVLIAKNGHTKVRPYWRLQYPDAADADGYDQRDEAEIAEELRERLLEATRIRLRSDVPVGAYLSGGLDSSIIAAAVKTIVSDRLRTFSVTFDVPEFDESEFQQTMVRALGTEHSSVSCSAADIGRMFPAVVRHAERPILRTAPAPLMALSDLAHTSGYKVVLTGEGADEVFGGYDIFKEAKLRRFCAAQPLSRRRPQLLQRLYPYLPALQNQSQRYREAFFATSADELKHPLFSHLPRFRVTAGAKAFYSAEMRAAVGDHDAVAALSEALPAEFARWHPLSQAQYLETAHLLPGYILSSQGDRMAMANAVEGRFPFLDHTVVEFASRIPPKLKIRGLREKYIVRKAMQDLLPPEINKRPKQPYRAPDSLSFVGKAAPDYVAERLSADAVGAAGYFEPRAVGKLVNKCGTLPSVGFRDSMALVGILSTQLWHREFVSRDGTAVAPSRAA
jgi:asparagine synthase (glutamine-hydrolysing)